jgi:hypothetical protein
MAKWVDWNDPHTAKTAQTFMNNVERIMNGLPIEQENPFVNVVEPLQPGEQVIFDASQVDFQGKFVPRKYFGTLQSVDPNGIALIHITGLEDTDDFSRLVSTDSGISESVMPPYEIGDALSVFVSLLQRAG